MSGQTSDCLFGQSLPAEQQGATTVAVSRMPRAARLSAFFVYGQRDRLPEPPSQPVPHRALFWAKTVGLIALSAGLYYLPPYVTCRNMKERGMFYYGTTISTCMDERLDERNETLDALARRLFTSL